MTHDRERALDRREFLKAGFAATALLPLAGVAFGAAAAHAADDKLVTEIEAAGIMVTALQYTNESAKPDQNCGNCQLYTAGEDGKGKCQLFQQGLVTEAGWCASWIKKVT